MAGPTSMQRYLFATSFDPEDEQFEEPPPPAALPPAPPPPPEPTFSAAEMEAARRAARREGESAARAEAAACLDAQLARALDGLGERAEDLVRQQQRDNAALAEQTVGIATTIARKLLPELARRGGLAEIEAVVRSCLADMVEEPRIVIRVANSRLDAVRDLAGRLAPRLGYAGSLVLLGEESLGPADCRVEWADGGAARLSPRLWQQIDDTITRALADRFQPPEATA